MVSDLMETFAVGAAVLGQLSAFYFYPYALLQIPIGVLLDRIASGPAHPPPRVVVPASLIVRASTAALG